MQLQRSQEAERVARGNACVTSSAPGRLSVEPHCMSVEADRTATQHVWDEDERRRDALVVTMEALLAPAMCVEPSIMLSGRIKSPASILEKATRKGLAVHQVHDVVGVRAIARRTRSCYRLADRIRGTFDVVEGHYDDYIAKPKPNGYRSIHITVRLPSNSLVEIQIRTQWMHTICERNPPQYKQF